jgi:hypothetical protein
MRPSRFRIPGPGGLPFPRSFPPRWTYFRWRRPDGCVRLDGLPGAFDSAVPRQHRRLATAGRQREPPYRAMRAIEGIHPGRLPSRRPSRRLFPSPLRRSGAPTRTLPPPMGDRHQDPAPSAASSPDEPMRGTRRDGLEMTVCPVRAHPCPLHRELTGRLPTSTGRNRGVPRGAGKDRNIRTNKEHLSYRALWCSGEPLLTRIGDPLGWPGLCRPNPVKTRGAPWPRKVRARACTFLRYRVFDEDEGRQLLRSRGARCPQGAASKARAPVLRKARDFFW